MSKAAFAALNILAAALVGFFAGYITNDCALARMFKGFKGLKLPFTKRRIFSSPPAIVKSKDKLADSLGKVVQDRLVGDPHSKRPSRLFSKIGEEELGNAIKGCVDELLSERLPAYFKGLSISELEGYEETSKGLSRLISEFCGLHAGDVVQEVLDNITLDELLTESQIGTVMEKLVDMAALEIRHFDKSILEKDVCLSDIFGEEESSELCKSFSKTIDIMDWAVKNPRSLETVLYSSGIYKIVYDSLTNAANAPLSELLGNGSAEEFITSLQPLMKKLLNSKAFQRILYGLADNICAAFNDIRAPLYNILPEREWEKLISFLSSKFPDAAEYLSQYLVERRGEIDNLIEKEVDAVIDEGTSNFVANTVRQLFRDVIIEYLRSINIVGTLDKYIERLSGAEDVERALRGIIFELLRNNTIADVSSRFLSAETVYGLLKNVPELAGKGAHGEFYRIAGGFRFSNVVSEEAIAKAADAIVRAAVPALVRWGLGSGKESLDRVCTGLIYRKAEELMHTPIEALVKNYGIGISEIYNKAGDMIHKNSGRIANALKSPIKSRIKRTVVGSLTKGKTSGIGAVAGEWLSGFALRLGSLRPSELFRKAADTSLAVSLSKLIHEKLIPSLVRERLNVSPAVSEKIRGMNTAEAGDMMQRWFGKELRPLCWLGGGVGLVFGLALESAYCALNVEYNSVWPWLLRLAVFGLIGIVTNKIAIYGVFRPYVPNWTSKFGFSYIPRNIGLVAEKSGNAIWFLLDGDQLSEKFEANHDNWCSQLTGLISKDDCAIIRELLEKNSGALSDLSAEKLLCFIKNHSIDIAERLCSVLAETEAGAILTEDACEHVVSSLVAYLNKNSRQLAEALYTKLSGCGYSIREIGIAPKLDSATFGKTLVGSLRKTLSFDKLRKLADKYESSYSRIKSKSVAKLFPSSSKKLPGAAASKLAPKLIEMLISERTVDFICLRLEAMLKKDMEPGRTLSDFFGGRLREIVDENLDRITGFILNKITDVLEASKADIIEGLNRATREKVNVFIRAAIDLDDFTARITERVIGYGLKPFFRREAGNISGRLHGFIDNEIYPIEIDRLRLDMRSLDLAPLIRHTVLDTRLRKETQSAVSVLIRLSARELVSQPLENLAEALNIRRLTDICDRLEPYIELSAFRDGFEGSEVFNKELSCIISDMLEDLIFSVPLGTLLTVYPEEAMKSAARKTFSYVLKKEKELNILRGFVLGLRKNYEGDCLGEYFDNAELERSVKAVIDDHGKDEKLTVLLSKVCGFVIERVNDTRFAFISCSMREQLIGAMVGAALETIESHFGELLQSVDVKNVVRQEISSMGGKEIEDMFNGFAKKQLEELVWMGKWGALFFVPGLKSGTGYIIFSLVYMLSGFKKQKNEDKSSSLAPEDPLIKNP